MNNKIKEHDVNCITINTDASFCPDTKAGGYAFWIVSDHFVIKKAGFFKDLSRDSNEAEIKCIGNALQTLLRETKLSTSKLLIINTDSTNAIRMIKERTNENSRVVNLLWKKVIKKVKSRVNNFRHVKGHYNKKDSRSYVNNWCDEHAKKYMKLKREMILKEKKNEEKT